MRLPSNASLLCGALTACALTGFAASSQAASSPAPQFPVGATIHVSPGGSDSNAGTAAAPLLTLQKALDAATGGQTVELSAGTYAWARDRTARSLPVVVTGAPGAAVTVQGINVNGGQKITFRGLRFSESVRVSMHQTLGAKQPSEDVAFVDDDITSASGSQCVVLRDFVARATFSGNTLHDCSTGIAGAGGANPSRDIAISGNTIRHVSADGIQFGDWSNVSITGNTIDGMSDPLGKIHNDAIQLTGDTQHIVISGNKLMHSDGQLIIMQPNVGPVDDVRVVNNVLTGSAGIPIQSSAVTNAAFIHNTIWAGNSHGLLVRSNGGRSTSDTVVIDNLTSDIQTYGGSRIGFASGNVTSCPSGPPKAGLQPGVVACLPTDPAFVAPASGDFRLMPGSPLRNTVTAAASKDLTGALRYAVTTPGAFN